ncbi:glycosyltransferase [Flavobacterium sp. F-380]|uniref:Glycosyltransferase n=1 Tax=Flavobacterium kayseriense TaxID=2764714 RepID=A0ABR7J7P4_9FLAO|nr:glycosyltransferase [Flavobacterium kayseriense]MBC5841472.1 glycosyltransferase [Flavobacterium kayseriense]MBC5848000.1 glycosyltransferase [Flavobacterium kayseriense]
MKKKIVFVIPSLDAGGGEKSLVNLLNCLDFTLYDVDLILFKKQGIFLNSVPKEVTIISIQDDYIHFTKNVFRSILAFTIRLKIVLALHRILFFLKSRRIKNSAQAEQYTWNNLSKSIAPFPNKYDQAIAFLEKSSIYLTVDKLNATSKIGWIHTNYASSGMNSDFDTNYFSQLNALVTVSPECHANLLSVFPQFSGKIKTIYNIVSPSIIESLSLKTATTDKRFSSFENTIVTVARLSYEKGCDLAIDASRIMKGNNINFKWFIIGEGSERLILEKQIQKYQLEENVFLIGLKENPYPYMKQCTVYVQPSRYEGKSIAIEEAKILQKPIVVTDFSTAKDQIIAGKTGVIADMTADGLAFAISDVLKNSSLQVLLSSNLAKEDLGTENEINKLYNILNC